MRLDKYLKVSRLIKRRTVAAEAADGGHITVNGKVAKPSTDVKVGDRLVLSFGQHKTEVEVLSVQETVRKDDAGGMYREI
ncbi:MAG: RNA-binding S4 domain-containing protein [Oscillospiraceae bacterium]|nr:RNA-binding S4 domain-containing protein [Oscillospiraceae bacterium]MBR1843087.1 RNA-binding S4 domain-containing protein [Oscillospiraceae bacterium]